MLKDSSGKIYLKYYMPVPKLIRIGKKEYITTVRHGISMLLVDESEVEPLLNFLGGCCGQKRKVFSLASEQAVNVFLTGNYQ